MIFGGGSIRARIDWARLERAEFTVHDEYSASSERLGELWTVWYVGPDGMAAEYRDASARPLRVRDVGASEPLSRDASRRARLARLRASFMATAEPAVLTLPGFRLPGDEVLLLDGNHRAVAAHLARVPVRLLLFLLHGPLTPVLLPDLEHHLDAPSAGTSMVRPPPTP